MPHLKIQEQLRAVVHGVAHGGDGQLIGADDRPCGRMEGAGHGPGQARLQPPGLLPVYDPQLLHAVCHSPGVELFDGLPVLVPEAYDHGAVPAVRHS